MDHEQLQSDMLGIYLNGDRLLQDLLAAYQSALVKRYWKSSDYIKKAIYAMRDDERQEMESLVARATADQTGPTEGK